MGAGQSAFPAELNLPAEFLQWNDKHMTIAALYFFNRFDENNNDAISADELFKMLTHVHETMAHLASQYGFEAGSEAPTEETAAEVLEELDQDESADLNNEELVPVLKEMMRRAQASITMQLQTQAMTEELFKSMDKNEDGKVSAEEFMEAFQESAEGMEFAEDDESAEEWAEWYQQFLATLGELFAEEAGEDAELNLAEFTALLKKLGPAAASQCDSPPSTGKPPLTKECEAKRVEAKKAAKPKPAPAKGTGKKGAKKATKSDKAEKADKAEKGTGKKAVKA